MKVFYSEAYNDTEVGWDTTRKAARVARLLYEQPVADVTVEEPTAASLDELAEVHDTRYLESLVKGTPLSLAASNGIGWDDHLFDAASASTGGIRDAALAALRDGCAGSLSSGLHHARRDGGEGYCTLNGLVVAARAAVADGARRVLVLDLDAHCGGGTASLITDLDEVEQIDVSVSCFDHYETRPDARLTMASAVDYLDLVDQELRAIAAPSSIDLVLYNAGMDPHEGAGGIEGITTETLRDRELLVFRWASDHGLPVAFTLAGGYQSAVLDLDGVAALHTITIETATRWN